MRLPPRMAVGSERYLQTRRVDSQIPDNRHRGARLLFFPQWLSLDAVRKSLLVTLMLATGQRRLRWPGRPRPRIRPAAHTHVQLEAKPPDEPSSSSSPDVEAAPDAAPSTGAMPRSRRIGRATNDKPGPPTPWRIRRKSRLTWCRSIRRRRARKKIQGRVTADGDRRRVRQGRGQRPGGGFDPDAGSGGDRCGSSMEFHSRRATRMAIRSGCNWRSRVRFTLR